MTDNQLIELFLPIIKAGLLAFGFTNTSVKQGNQPTQQGINTNPTVYFFKLYNKRFGFQGRQDVWNVNTSAMEHTESQYMECTFQVNALAIQDPADTTLPTASDLVNAVADIMQSENTQTILNNSNVGILRVTDVRNPYFMDDHDQFEAVPSFDFTLTYQNFRTIVDPVIQLPVTLDIQGV